MESKESSKPLFSSGSPIPTPGVRMRVAARAHAGSFSRSHNDPDIRLTLLHIVAKSLLRACIGDPSFLYLTTETPNENDANPQCHSRNISSKIKCALKQILRILFRIVMLCHHSDAVMVTQ